MYYIQGQATLLMIPNVFKSKLLFEMYILDSLDLVICIHRTLYRSFTKYLRHFVNDFGCIQVKIIVQNVHFGLPRLANIRRTLYRSFTINVKC